MKQVALGVFMTNLYIPCICNGGKELEREVGRGQRGVLGWGQWKRETEGK